MYLIDDVKGPIKGLRQDEPVFDIQIVPKRKPDTDDAVVGEEENSTEDAWSKFWKLMTMLRAPRVLIIQPDVKDIEADLARRGVKIRDFGFPFPVVSDSSSSTDSSCSSAPPLFLIYSHLNLACTLTTEIFGPFYGLSRCDFRWRGSYTGKYPIQGKTLRRLLYIGWLTETEPHSRATSKDLEELARYDASPRARYPWKPFHVPVPSGTDTAVAIMAERRTLLDVRYYEEWSEFDRLMEKEEKKIDAAPRNQEK